MKIAIMQPYFFPYIGYFQLINAVDKFIIFDDVNYIKKGWINRNRILLQGQEYMFTVPLKKASQNKKINELEISYELNWRNKLLRTIEIAYRRAPLFNDLFPLIIEIISVNENNLSGFLTNSIMKLNAYLNIDTEISKTSDNYVTEKLKGQDKILEICRQEKADEYVNPIGGKDLYNKNEFHERGIKLHLLETDEFKYERCGQNFIPFLSIIDVMMFNSVNSIKEMLKKYTLL